VLAEGADGEDRRIHQPRLKPHVRRTIVFNIQEDSMQAARWFGVSIIILFIAVGIAAQERGGQRGAAPAASGPAMTLAIPGFTDGGQIPVKFSQAAEGAAPGEGTSPAISWANPPAGTQSFFLHMHDMDVARNKTTDDQAHWVVWNIPATATGLPEGVPKGPQLADGSYQVSATGAVYRGPGAPASGPPHHYMFELFALDTKLEVRPTADAFETRANVVKAIQGHILAKAVYGGLFRRPQ
jgi:Raf kinase inhibitor-like YbhB/YbcL family protein